MPPVSEVPQWRFLVDENLPARLAGYLQRAGYQAEHAFEVGLRGRYDPDVVAYARAARATLITQDHDLEPDTTQYPPPHPGIVLVELPQDWPREDRMRRILAALRSIAGQSLENAPVIIEPPQILVRR